MFDDLAKGKSTGKEGEGMNCPVCNRLLKSPTSISRGIGPVCERKLEKLKDSADEDQLKMELKENAKNVLQRVPPEETA